MKTQIKEIEINDLNYIADIWKKSLPSDFFSVLGKSFIIKVYFKAFFNLEKKIGFKIILNDKIVGFVLYGRFDKLINEIIKKKFTSLFFSSIKSLFLNFRSTYVIFNVIIFKFLIRNFNYLNDNNTELLVIAIDPTFHRQGLGTKLINESIDIIKKINFTKEIYVKTQLKNPIFYEKCNFKLVKRVFGRFFLVRML